MKAFFQYLMKIKYRDLFKHRWALVVELQRMPRLTVSATVESYETPCISRLPEKRPLTETYNQFVNRLSKSNNLVITGHEFTLSELGNVGSVLPHNFKLAKLTDDARCKAMQKMI